MAKKKSDSSPANKKVVESLRVVLADTYALMGQTHLCHWNVEGPSFFALHTAFEEQYTELFAAADEIAERIRALGAYSPGGLRSLADIAGLNELDEEVNAEKMVKSLVEDHTKLVKDAAKARDLAGEGNDNETEDLMIARIQVHEKTIWMLKSYLK